MKIIITDKLAKEGVERLKKAGFEVTEDFETKGAALAAKIGAYDALIVRSGTQVTAEVINGASKMKVIGRAGAGLDNIDVKAAEAKKIKVINSPEGNTISAAEHTIAVMMALCRNIPKAHMSLLEKKWDRDKFKGAEVCGKTLGVIGLGKIGFEVAKRMKAFDMKILAFDPYAKPEVYAAVGAKKVDLDTLFKESDFITVHVPKSPETAKMLNSQAFEKMKQGVRVVNVARGRIIDEKALYDALKSGKVAGAAIDVYEKEPPENWDLIGLDNVVHTPHLGASTVEAQNRCGVQIADKVIAELKGKK
ncbi:MAG: hydroxyacid dehydrogenase [Candidatus Diapherotrites archaeon]